MIESCLVYSLLAVVTWTSKKPGQVHAEALLKLTKLMVGKLVKTLIVLTPSAVLIVIILMSIVKTTITVSL